MDKKYEGVTPRGNGIQISFNWQGKRYRPTIKLKPTPANLLKAHRHRQAILHSIDCGTFDYAATFPSHKNTPEQASETVGHYLNLLLKRKKLSVKDGTYQVYKGSVRMLADLSEIDIHKFIRRDARQWADNQPSKLKTIRNHLSVLRQAIELAVDDEVITHNPLNNWNYDRIEPPTTVDQIKPFDFHEQSLLVDAAEGADKNLLLVALWTGMRLSEYIALRWSDIDFENNKISINKVYTSRSKADERTKTAKSNRIINLLKPARQALLDQRKYTQLKGDFVFLNRSDQRWSGDRQLRTQWWKPIISRSGIDYRQQKHLRHTFASMMLSSGENVYAVSQMMGHSNIQITVTTYARFIQTDGIGDKAIAAQRAHTGHK